MKSTTDSKHASIHDIVNENKLHLRKLEINQLFSTPQLSELDTSQLHHHPYMASNQTFTFFVHELQKWNKKIRQREVWTFYHAEMSRNNFLYSQLKIISLKKPNQIGRYLNQLMKWYTRNSYNIPQPSVLMKKYNQNQEWEVRKTFKSNTPQQIGNYRRRFLCSPQTQKATVFAQNIFELQAKKENGFFDTKIQGSKYNRYKSCGQENFEDSKQQNDKPFRQIANYRENRRIKLQNNEVKRKRQQEQVNRVQDSWKTSHSRFGQKTCQNFFKGKFMKSKQISEITTRVQPRKVQTAAYNSRYSNQQHTIQQIKKGRLRTSLGIRKNFANEQNAIGTNLKSQITKTQSNEQARQSEGKWIDNFIVDEDQINLRNTTIGGQSVGMRLISNPFDAGKSKIKRKRK